MTGAACCLLACLPLLLGGAGEFVLCLGEGHLAIEPIHEAPCRQQDCGAPGMDFADDHNLSSSPSSGAHCLDIPISIDSVADRNGKSRPEGAGIIRLAFAKTAPLHGLQACPCGIPQPESGPGPTRPISRVLTTTVIII